MHRTGVHLVYIKLELWKTKDNKPTLEPPFHHRTNQILTYLTGHRKIMGAEAERNQQTETLITVPTTVPNPNPITETQFVAWKLRKVLYFFRILSTFP